MDPSILAAFAVTFFVFAASPGPDNMTIVARTLSHGAASGIAYGLGTVTGILVFLVLAAFGLSVVAPEMGLIMTVLRYAGAAYLVAMGIMLWRAAPVLPAETLATDRRGIAAVFATGVALNLGNPKMPLFYIALLPHVRRSVSLALPGRPTWPHHPCGGGGRDRRSCSARAPRPALAADATSGTAYESRFGQRHDRRRRSRCGHPLSASSPAATTFSIRLDSGSWRSVASGVKRMPFGAGVTPET